MELLLLNPPFPSRPQMRASLMPSKSSIKACNTYRYRIPIFNFHKTLSIPFQLTFFATSRDVHVSAYFGRPTSRRNSLREKLIDEDSRVRKNKPISQNPRSEFQNPNPSFDYSNSNKSQESLDCGGVKDVKEGDSSHGVDVTEDLSVSEVAGEWNSESNKCGESVLLMKLEKWVDQYKKDTAYWGIGSSPIFTVFLDIGGKVNRVLVNEDEVLKRSNVEKGEPEDLKEFHSKLLQAKALAIEMERGGSVIPRNSSLAKFVVLGEKSSSASTIHSFVLQPEVIIPMLPKVGRLVFFGFIVVWAIKKLFTSRDQEERCTELEKEMMRRKIKSRKEKEALEKDKVEVVQLPLESPMVSNEKPKLDKQELMKSIFKAKASKERLALADHSCSQATEAIEFDAEIQKIRSMARQARDIESREQCKISEDREEKNSMNKDTISKMKTLKENKHNIDAGKERDMLETSVRTCLHESKDDDTGFLSKGSTVENRFMQTYNTSYVKISENRVESVTGEDIIHSSDTHDHESCMSKNASIKTKLRVIRSVKEARELLAKKGSHHIQEPQVNTVQESANLSSLPSGNISSSKPSDEVDVDGKVFGSFMSSTILPATKNCEEYISKRNEFVPTKNGEITHPGERFGLHDLQKPQTFLNSKIDVAGSERPESLKRENWMENNFHEVEPIVKMIGDGIRDNYKIAKEKAAHQISTDLTKLGFEEDDSELEWMKDDGLREIVSRVRDNELAGRDPFYLMDAEDKLKFFKGLEKKVVKENEKLLQVHEYLHANIENIDYGADGISLYDPPEKIIPRWKVPLTEKHPKFLNSFLKLQSEGSSGNAGTSCPVKKDEQNFHINSRGAQDNQNIVDPLTSANYELKKNLCDKDPKDSRTIIESSDGSIRAGKKSGKEYWQHTKKWSRGFLDSYNAETDPEVKSIMKDIGKDLDRWITEKEIQEAAELMTELPRRNKKFMEKKINKLKREMQLFGPQAVMSKYREYAEEKEEDRLWWLDLPHILCIELYVMENGEQKIGFYSLEMAADLELDPKPRHVIAFVDSADCKNLCYIIQAHMAMLGNGYAFVVPQLPKDAFREAKANGFSVTVIRKGELQLNVDQTLEEVEEQITEIGSKIYHDRLMQECSVNINSLTKGVFGVSNQTSSSKRKRPSKK
uniref:Uncharacterized protein n=1 Tax=Rhizophora mucronata TaxID=61149 RepID=A0A2P2JCR4_RHIMU